MLLDLNGEGTTVATAGVRLPGVLVMEWVPSFGNSSASTDPASIAGKEFYGRVRAAYSGALDADAPDFMVYVGGLDSVFAYIGWLKRVYRTISTYSPDNLEMPDALMGAYGFDDPAQLSDFRNNKTRFWQGINELILMTRKFKCPAVMDLFNRHYWMSDNVYADAPSTRAQLFVFNLLAVYKTQQVTEAGTGSEQVQGLKLEAIPHVKGSKDASIVDTLLNFGYDLVRAFDSWDSSYTISGYLQRAFDGVPSFTVAELLQDELITASFVPEVLSQIENARCVVPNGQGWGLAYGTTNARNPLYQMIQKAVVTQNTLANAVVSTVDFTLPVDSSDANQSSTASLLKVMPNGVAPALNIHSEAPTIADSVIASRLQPVVEYDAATTATEIALHITGGTELILEMSIMYLLNNKYWRKDRISQVNMAGWKVTSTSMPVTWATNHMLEQFAYHPIVYDVTNTDSTNANKNVVYPQTDVVNITKLSKDMLKNLHTICFYSELNSFSI